VRYQRDRNWGSFDTLPAYQNRSNALVSCDYKRERAHAYRAMTSLDQYIDQHFATQTKLLQELVRIPTDTPPGNNAPHAEITAKLLEAMGYKVERHIVPEADVKAYGMQSITNLIVRHRFSPDGPTIALNAHGDVVPPGDGWTTDPYGGEIKDGKLYGRAAAASKSDFATYISALNALRELHKTQPLRGTVELMFTYDEEFGGELGPGWLLKNNLTRPDMVIAAGFSYAVITAHNGALHLEISVYGRGAHVAEQSSGIDALRAAHGIMSVLYQLSDSLAATPSKIDGIGTPKLNIGTISAGTNTNVVPDKAVLKVDRRMIPEEDPIEIEAHLRRLIARAAEQFPEVKIEIKRLLLARAFTPIAGQEKLADAFCKEATRVFGEPIAAKGTGLYTDARLFAEAGIPAILYGAGPRTILEANAKRADENVALEDLRRATKVVANAVAKLLV
jgi:acetylornithine deacetylase/succinyl-diaminopimelate desuccinylase-like protein